jgi:hypothetical protein
VSIPGAESRERQRGLDADLLALHPVPQRGGHGEGRLEGSQRLLEIPHLQVPEAEEEGTGAGAFHPVHRQRMLRPGAAVLQAALDVSHLVVDHGHGEVDVRLLDGRAGVGSELECLLDRLLRFGELAEPGVGQPQDGQGVGLELLRPG